MYSDKIFINKKYKIMICMIEKVACSSTRKWLLSMEPKTKSHKHEKFRCDVYKNIYRCSRFNLKKIKNLFPKADLFFYKIPYLSKIFRRVYFKKYFKIVFVRNPWKRLVSAYLSKFCTADIDKLKGAREAANYIYDKYNLDKGEMLNFRKKGGGITFNQFIEYLQNINNLENVDPHWRPQYLFLEDFEYDFIGKIENQKSNIEYLKSKLDITEDYPHLTSHQYGSEKIESFNLSPYELNEIRDKYEGYPNYKNFYNERLKTIAEKIYKKDIEIFNYEFDN